MISVEAATLIGRSPATQRRTRRGERLMRRASADCHRGPHKKTANGSRSPSRSRARSSNGVTQRFAARPCRAAAGVRLVDDERVSDGIAPVSAGFAGWGRLRQLGLWTRMADLLGFLAHARARA